MTNTTDVAAAFRGGAEAADVMREASEAMQEALHDLYEAQAERKRVKPETLTDFLLQRIDADLAAIPPLGDDPSLPHGQHWSEVPFPMASAFRAVKVLAAQRAIVEAVSDVAWATYAVRDVVLEHLATVYRDHPDYRAEWVS